MQDPRGRWLLLLHQLPPQPDYLRVKVRRRLQRLGAVLLRNSVYVLPGSTDALEDFQWLANEIVADGGDATICGATFLSGVSDEDLERRFRAERDADYDEVARSADAIGAADPDAARDELLRLKRRVDAIAAIDFLSAAGRRRAEAAIRAAESRIAPLDDAKPEAAEAPVGAVWVTRQGVFIDRIASAWLIRRFIDPRATFRFVPGRPARRGDNEFRFDMVGGEFTHEGDRCTFETLAARFVPADAALRAIGEIVHDIDLKDGKFGRGETSGVAAVIQGIAHDTKDDAERIARGSLVFDGLYRQLGTRDR